MHDKPIVVGVDGSSSALHAVRWAAGEAQRRGVSLKLVHAYEIPVGYPPGMVDPHLVRQSFHDRGRQWLRQARGAAADIAPAVPVELTLTRGVVVPTLISESSGATMIVLGTRGLGGFTGLLVGSTSVALAGRALCPVVVTRGRALDGPVVVGVDGTPVGEAAIAFAFEEAATRGCELIAVHAWIDSTVEILLARGVTAWDFAAAELHATEILAERLAGWQEKYPEVTVTRVITRDSPARALLHQSETAALVVVGTRGRGGFRGLVLGSISQQLLYHAPGPVAVVRTEPDKEA